MVNTRVKVLMLGTVAASSLVTACGMETATEDEATSTDSVSAAPGSAKPAGPQATTVVAHDPVELRRMDDYVKNRIDRRSVLKTLRTSQGRKVDCLDILAQPALRGRPIATPPALADAEAFNPKPGQVPAVPEPLFSLADGREDQCAPGTVPVREVTVDDLRRFASVDEFFKKVPSHVSNVVTAAAPPSGGLTIIPPHNGPTAQHQYAHAARSVTNWGAETNINIWDPFTELNSEFSLGQIWVSGNGPLGVETLEVGLQHYHDLYNDDNQHLFIYSTRDNYTNSSAHPGCYNNSCGDFVQLSSTWHPGTTWFNSSISGGTQFYINVHWAKAGDTGDWWLSVQGEWVGYYPRGDYNGIINHASRIDFGGEIIDNRNLNLHTSTDMGSGAFPSAGWQRAAWMNQIRYNDSNPGGNGITWAEATGLTPSRSDAACYDISYVESTDPNWHTYFFYGGPGFQNPACL